MFLHQNIHLFKDTTPSLLTSRWVVDLQWLARSFSWLDESLVFQKILDNKAYYIRKLPKLKQLKKQLRSAQQALPSEEDVLNILHSTRYSHFILGLTEWLIQLEKTAEGEEGSQALLPFAESTLSNGWLALKKNLAEDSVLSIEKLLPQQGVLAANLMTGLSFGNIFDPELCAEYRYPWLDIYEGIHELSMLDAIYELAAEEQDSETQYEYFKWVKRKQDSLLSAIEQSKQIAIQKELYWLVPEV